MLYPAYIHKDEGCAYGISFPDIPGCFSAADDFCDIQKNAQEAVELHLEGESEQLPKATTPEQWLDQEDYQGGFWMMIDIDTTKINMGKPMRLNISLPSKLVEKIDRYAAEHHMTRSGLISKATEKLIG